MLLLCFLLRMYLCRCGVSLQRQTHNGSYWQSFASDVHDKAVHLACWELSRGPRVPFGICRSVIRHEDSPYNGRNTCLQSTQEICTCKFPPPHPPPSPHTHALLWWWSVTFKKKNFLGSEYAWSAHLNLGTLRPHFHRR